MENVDSAMYLCVSCTENLKSTCTVAKVRECKSHFRVTLISLQSDISRIRSLFAPTEEKLIKACKERCPRIILVTTT